MNGSIINMPPDFTTPLDTAQAEARPCCAPALVSLANAPTGGSAQANDTAAPTDVQKRLRRTTRVSPLADRQFLNEFKSLSGIASYHAPALSDVAPIVSMGMGYEPSSPLPSHLTKTPRHWRDATDETQGFFAFQALAEAGPVVAFTAWCSPDIDAKARATGKPLPWLRKRLKEKLDAALGPVEWEAALEEGKTKEGKLLLHVHGAGAFGDLTRSRRDKIREAIRGALGEWEGPGARYQTDLKIARDAGWATYVTKRCWLARPYIRERFASAGPRSPWRLSFDGPALTVTNGVRARAKELHRQARELVMEARERAKVPAELPVASESETPVSEAHRPTRGALAAHGEPAGLALAARACASEPETIRSRPMTAARPRDPPGPGSRVSAGPDPPLPERGLVCQVSERKLAALAVAQRDDGRAGHEPSLPRHDGLAAHTGAAGDRDDDRRVRVSHRPGACAADGAGEGDPELPDAVVVACGLPGSGRPVRQLPGDRDGEQRRGLRKCHTGQENRHQGESELPHARRRSVNGRACHRHGASFL